MNCPSCRRELVKKKLEKFEIADCNFCKGLWIDSFTFDKLKEFESPFSPLLKINIWEDAEKHKVIPSSKSCPQCEKKLYKTEYADSHVHLDICPFCHGIWFDRGELEKVIAYIDKEISDETLSELFNELGEELKDFLIGQKSFEKEIKHVGLILKLVEYRVFSKFPLLQKLANSLPM
ncbi:MAG: zf-TFIIB domain-containing protein [Candidatus Aureabacteria bacterium]|nr:zf-TFIIB domain-containing protein [Candidatus Auribacterota bacterium]